MMRTLCVALLLAMMGTAFCGETLDEQIARKEARRERAKKIKAGQTTPAVVPTAAPKRLTNRDGDPLPPVPTLGRFGSFQSEIPTGEAPRSAGAPDPFNLPADLPKLPTDQPSPGYEAPAPGASNSPNQPGSTGPGGTGGSMFGTGSMPYSMPTLPPFSPPFSTSLLP